jgi:dimethylhistidine N-methyltransferase
MTTIASPAILRQVDERLASDVQKGLSTVHKWLPPRLFYDSEGSRLFDLITDLPEYYLTRTEREILTSHAEEIVARAAGSKRLRIIELGAGSADKTRLLLTQAVAMQGSVVYEPVDVSPGALAAAKERIELEIAAVAVAPRVMDYTHGPKLDLAPANVEERRLVLHIGSSIGNFDPSETADLLRRVRAGLRPGDALLLGVDLIKDEALLLAAYDDAAGVTAAFNLNMLAHLNRELDADFDLAAFEHRALWNLAESRIEMHLQTRKAQSVHFDRLDFDVDFSAGESIHTENSYKYLPGQIEATLSAADFAPVETWTDPQGWFAVCLARVE